MTVQKQRTVDETRNEIRKRFQALPDETLREYEKEIVTLVMSGQPAHFKQILEELLEDSDDKIAFAAFCALCEASRRNKNYSRQRELLALHMERFKNHPFLKHVMILQYIDNFNYDRYEEILSLAKENIESMPQNAGVQHAFADLVAIAFEHSDPSGFNCPEPCWAEDGMQAVQLAICLDPGYAKFYCTKARLLAIRGEYDQASVLIKKAVDLEDSEKEDYAMRINGYLNYLQQIQAKKQNLYMENRLNQYMEKKMQEYARDIDAKQEQIRQQTSEVMGELQNSMAKNLEFIGLFAGIISFTIGSITISSSLAERSFVGAAGLIVVLMGALLCVFAGFGIVLHGLENKKWRRNLIVFLLGVIIAVAGSTICFLL